MPEYLNATEAARRYPVSERTIRKWIDKGVLNAPIERVNGVKQYAISTDELEAVLMRRNTTGTLPEQSGTLLIDRIAALEQRVSELEAIVQALQRPTFADVSTPRHTQQEHAMPTTEARNELPDNLVSFASFYRAHGIPETSARRAIGAHFAIVSGQWPGGIRQCLDESGRRDFCTYFTWQKKLRQCGLFDCVCKQFEV